MKNYLFLAVLVSMLSFISCAVEIPQGPPEPLIEVRPAPPSPVHVWVGGYYGYSNNNYVWNRGFYQVPPSGRREWNEGRYERNQRGRYTYRLGHWR